MIDKKLDYDKVIMAKGNDGSIFILLPQQDIDRMHPDEMCYLIRGYDWFNIKEGCFNSCICWKTKQKAVSAYDSYHITNAKIILSQI